MTGEEGEIKQVSEKKNQQKTTRKASGKKDYLCWDLLS